MTCKEFPLPFCSPFYKWNFCDPSELSEKEGGGVAVLAKTKVSSPHCTLGECWRKTVEGVWQLDLFPLMKWSELSH